MATISEVILELMEKLIRQMERKNEMEREHEKCSRCKMPPELVDRQLVLMRKELEKQEFPIKPPQGEEKSSHSKNVRSSGGLSHK